MPTNNGTLVIAAIRTNDSNDTFATAYSNELRGGHHTYQTYLALNNIPTDRKQTGMLVTVTNDPEPVYNATYILQDDLISWAYLESKFYTTMQLDNISASYDATILLASPYVYRISKIFTKTTFGSCTIDILNNNVAMDGYKEIYTDSSNLAEVVSNDPTNYIPVDNSLVMRITNPSSGMGALLVQIELQRILPVVQTPSLSVGGLQGAYFNQFSV